MIDEIRSMMAFVKATPTHMGFILDCWTKTAHDYHRTHAKATLHHIPCDEAVFSVLFRDKIKRIMAKSDTVVAVSRENRDDIFGFAVTEQTDPALLVHWVQTKKELWNHGIASELIKLSDTGKPIIVTAAGSAWKRYHAKLESWKHVPWWLIY